MNEGLLIFPLFPALLATVFHESVQISLLVEFAHFLLVALLTNARLLESWLSAAKAAFVIVVLANCALKD